MLEKILGTHSDRELKRIKHIVDRIEDLRDIMVSLSEDELRSKTAEFKERIAKGETLDDIMPEAYAVVREASRRTVGMEPYKVQLQAAVILHQGRIAEAKTGEGKALGCVIPSYLNALAGKGVHVVTVNDYLAERDAKQASEIMSFLGLSVGCVLNHMDNNQRRSAYGCDITYVTNNELGFDYLRDNMAVYENDKVLRGLDYVIIDEVDSILIDEARTPLIISGEGKQNTKIYEVCDLLAKQLKRGEADRELDKMDYIIGEQQEESGDFIINEKERNVHLTADGIAKVEKFFNIENLADPENTEINHSVIMALKANYMMEKDVDYVVKDGIVYIVDEFTGRMMHGRRYSDGLHQAVEAKEKVEIKKENVTLATITFQNFFNKYRKKSGLTGTALTEENEFREIYGMDVVVIPTNLPVQRIDHGDLVYKTKAEKFKAVIKEVETSHAKGQPVLVGTVDIETSEMISGMLKKKGIDHQVLNAKRHDKEAEIVKMAGQKGAVTIATNMAGRGTDIKLGEGVRELGGLKVIGTERHESRRIDNQLRGRSGRQGDPGESRFYISLEDDLMRLFGSEKLMRLFNSLGFAEDEPIEHKMLSNAIESAQRKIESNNYEIRKRLLEFDEVINQQREIIYADRNKVLAGDNMSEVIRVMISEVIKRIVDRVIHDDANNEDWDIVKLSKAIGLIVPIKTREMTAEEFRALDKQKLTELMIDQAIDVYKNIEAQFPCEDQMRELERRILLKVSDEMWKQHIDDMDQLRQGIGLQAYGQKDPLQEYKMIGYNMFDKMVKEIQLETVALLCHVKIVPRVVIANGENQEVG